MALTFIAAGEATWICNIGSTRVLLDDRSGAPAAEQVAIAHMLDDMLDSASARAAAYLDLFVDRAKACGNGDEHWWLDEVDLRPGVASDPGVYALLFSLDGDDGGMWTVDINVRRDEHRPFRFERLQG